MGVSHIITQFHLISSLTQLQFSALALDKTPMPSWIEIHVRSIMGAPATDDSLIACYFMETVNAARHKWHVWNCEGGRREEREERAIFYPITPSILCVRAWQ